jgi:hypothetical protein
MRATTIMNPLLFADWKRMNRAFTRLMWVAAAIMVCVVVVALASAHTPPAHTRTAGHGMPAAAARYPAP